MKNTIFLAFLAFASAGATPHTIPKAKIQLILSARATRLARSSLNASIERSRTFLNNTLSI